jgi:hypothetical protein
MHMKYLLLALAISSASVFAEEEPSLTDLLVSEDDALPCIPKPCTPQCKLVKKTITMGVFKIPYMKNVCVIDNKCLAAKAACLAKIQALMKAAAAAEKNLKAKAALANAKKATHAQKAAAKAAAEKELRASARMLAMKLAAYRGARTEYATILSSILREVKLVNREKIDKEAAKCKIKERLIEYEKQKKLHLRAVAKYKGAKSSAAKALADYRAELKAHCDVEARHAALVKSIGHGHREQHKCRKAKDAFLEQLAILEQAVENDDVDMQLPCTPTPCSPVCTIATKYTIFGSFKIPYQTNVCKPNMKCIQANGQCQAKLLGIMRESVALEEKLKQLAAKSSKAGASSARKAAAAKAAKAEAAKAAQLMAMEHKRYTAAVRDYGLAKEEYVTEVKILKTFRATEPPAHKNNDKLLKEYEAAKLAHMRAVAKYKGANSAAAKAEAAYKAAVKAHCTAQARHSSLVTQIGFGHLKKTDCKKFMSE